MHFLRSISLTTILVSLLASPIIAFGSSTFNGARNVFPSQINPTGSKLFVFSPKYKAWGAYTPNGELVGYGRASGGGDYCKDVGRSCRTPQGKFIVNRKGDFNCKSGKYPLPNGGAPMPYCMFFSSAHAIHGSPYVPDHNASHGCIRVKTHAAKWLKDNFISVGTRVYVLPYH